MRSQTGGLIPMGYGMLHCQSSKKNLSSNISTESELIGTSEYTPFNVYMVMFMEGQGYYIKNNIIFRYNQSTMSMENNGGDYCTGSSRNINIRHLFLKDGVNKREIKVKYCPTNLMIANYFKKPLQEKMLKTFRDLIMIYVHINDLFQAIELSAKERVEK